MRLLSSFMISSFRGLNLSVSEAKFCFYVKLINCLLFLSLLNFQNSKLHALRYIAEYFILLVAQTLIVLYLFQISSGLCSDFHETDLNFFVSSKFF